jgi:DNA-binding NarL/FixJ family response regulator
VLYSVMVVDDDPGFLAITGRILADLGVDRISTAADAAQAIEVAHEVQPVAVLVDIGLPDRSGIDLAYELADLPWRPRVVLTSSDGEAFIAIEAELGRPPLSFIAKQALDAQTLGSVLLPDRPTPPSS